MEVSAKNISKKSLFKFLLQSIGFGLMAFSLLMGIFALYGYETVAWNEEYKTGFEGLFVSIPLGLFLGLLFTCFMWVIGIVGLWVNSHLKGVTIVFEGVIEPDGE